MTKIVKFMGKEWKLENDTPLWVFVPEGETEAHVFFGDKFFGKRSDIETLLTDLCLSAEKAALGDGFTPLCKGNGVRETGCHSHG